MLAADVASDDVESAVGHLRPQVVVLGDAPAETPLRPPARARPAPGTVVLAHDPSPPYGSLLLALGASCLAANATPREIVAAIHFASSGGRRFVRSDGRRVERARHTSDSLLTVRELAVLSLLSGERSYGEIALSLGIEVETVRSHTVALRRKLEVRGRRDLIGLRVPLLPGAAP